MQRSSRRSIQQECDHVDAVVQGVRELASLDHRKERGARGGNHPRVVAVPVQPGEQLVLIGALQPLDITTTSPRTGSVGRHGAALSQKRTGEASEASKRSRYALVTMSGPISRRFGVRR